MGPRGSAHSSGHFFHAARSLLTAGAERDTDGEREISRVVVPRGVAEGADVCETTIDAELVVFGDCDVEKELDLVSVTDGEFEMLSDGVLVRDARGEPVPPRGRVLLNPNDGLELCDGVREMTDVAVTLLQRLTDGDRDCDAVVLDERDASADGELDVLTCSVRETDTDGTTERDKLGDDVGDTEMRIVRDTVPDGVDVLEREYDDETVGEVDVDTDLQFDLVTDGDAEDERETDTVFVADRDCEDDAEKEGDGVTVRLMRIEPDTVVVMEPERDAETVTEFDAVVDDDEDWVTDGVDVRDSDGDAVGEMVDVGDGKGVRDRTGDTDDVVEGVVRGFEKDRDGEVETLGVFDEKNEAEFVLDDVGELDAAADTENTDAVWDTESDRRPDGDF